MEQVASVKVQVDPIKYLEVQLAQMKYLVDLIKTQEDQINRVPVKVDQAKQDQVSGVGLQSLQLSIPSGEMTLVEFSLEVLYHHLP